MLIRRGVSFLDTVFQCFEVRFEKYNQQQNWLISPFIEELIPTNHPVRIANGVIETMDLSSFMKSINKEGKPAFHPKMMLKVMVYAYMDNTYSIRKIEKAMRENVNYMWFSDNQVAGYNTIVRFPKASSKIY
ncbi:transposase [Weeksellaceae bacterium TAE3-ERU29]|nr:transposase [Weeksellaceae bacterium TAE3-ERU29]